MQANIHTHEIKYIAFKLLLSWFLKLLQVACSHLKIWVELEPSDKRVYVASVFLGPSYLTQKNLC